MTGADTVLETRALNKSFGALQVARDIDFVIHAGERHALIGPNGAGKTTFVNLLTGVLAPSSGSVLLHGRNITRIPEHQRIKQGIARTFQINTLFNGLTVLENIYIALSERHGIAWRMMRPAGARPEIVEEAVQLLERLRLGDDALKEVHELPYGRQRLVEFAIALSLRPKVLLLDEPTAGVPSTESHIIFEAIDELPEEIAVLIIDHDMDVVFRFAERITVLVAGSVLASGTPEEIRGNKEVRAAYLGEAVT